MIDNDFYKAKECHRRAEMAIKTKYKKPSYFPIDLNYLTALRLKESLMKAMLRGHFNVSLMFYQKYYFEDNLYAILDAELEIYRDLGYKVSIEKKESATQGIYYKVRIDW